MNLKKEKCQKGFSLMETVILLVILAVVIAASTPIFSRKIVNIGEIGPSLGGGTHGRYEIFVKEILQFEGTVLEKTSNPGINGNIIVYEKKDDKEFKDLKGKDPTVSGDFKSVLYEEISDVTGVIRDGNNVIVKAKIKIKNKNNNEEFVVQDGGRYIFVYPQVTYRKGSLATEDGTTTFKPNLMDINLPNNQRIIEGNLVKSDGKNSATGNNLWILDNQKNFNAKVVPIPWERVVTGKKEIIDRAIKPNAQGDYIGTFTLPETAVRPEIYAVGGGGAGGGPITNESKTDNIINATISPQNATAAQLTQMQNELGNAFKEAAKKKGYNFDSIANTTIVKIVNDATYGDKNKPAELLEDNTYIALNKANGTITVKFDVRKGLIFPHELLKYTETLGGATQQAKLHNMPKWVDWQTIIDGRFRTGAFVCGGAGGGAGSFIWKTTKNDDICLRPKVGTYSCNCTKETNTCYQTCYDTCYDTCYKTCYKTCYNQCCDEIHTVAGVCLMPYNCNPHDCNPYNCKPYDCNAHNCNPHNCNPYKNCKKMNVTCPDKTYYTCPADGYSNSVSGDCSKTAACPSNAERKRIEGVVYTHTYKGGSGGAAPACVWIGAIASKPMSIGYTCYPGGSGGGSKTVTDGLNSTVSASGLNGKAGTTCSVTLQGVTSYSYGGSGGIACIQDQLERDLDKKLTDANNAFSNADDKILDVLRGIGFSSIPDYINTSSEFTLKYVLDYAFMCRAMASTSCGRNGSAGTAYSNSTNISKYNKDNTCKFSNNNTVKCMSGGTGKPANNTNYNSETYGLGLEAKTIYNYIYTWTIPYSTNLLGYGEAGEPGDFIVTVIDKANFQGPLKIKLGKGGSWTNDNWKNGLAGINGTDTVITALVGSNEVYVTGAKGGRGGRANLKTSRYALCYANDRNKACSSNANVTCCQAKPRTSEEILATRVYPSKFETIRSVVGNSTIVGIGAGRGAQGIGSSSGSHFEVYGNRQMASATAPSNFDINKRRIYKKTNANTEGASAETAAIPASLNYKNKALKPANINFKGGDGAVIITW